MPQPLASYIHVDSYLSNLAVGFMRDPGQYVADQIFPVVRVDKQSDKYPIFDLAALARIHARIRAPGSKAAVSGYTMSNDSYFADNIALAHPIPFEHLRNADVDLDRAAVRFITDQIKIAKEQLVLGKINATTTWGVLTDQTGAGSGGSYAANTFNQWDVSGTTPVRDVFAWKQKVRDRCLRMPNLLVLAEDVANECLNHADIKARFNYVKAGTLSYEDLTQAFFPAGDGRVIVPSATYNSAAEGQTGVYAQLFTSGRAWLGYVNQTPDATGDQPSAGYQFAWDGLGAGIDAGGIYMLSPHDQNMAGDNHVRIYEGGYFVDAKRVSTDCGLLATGILS